MLLSATLTLICASLLTATRASPALRVAHESRRSLPSGWTRVRRAEPDVVLPLSVALVQSNLENLEAYLLDVAHPESPNYSKHWTPAQVADKFRPSMESVDAVRTWLAEDGSIETSRIQLSQNGAWILANVTVDEAENLLGTEYYVYEHSDHGREHVACHGAYHIPEHVSKHVDVITPTLHFDVKVRRHGSKDTNVAKNIGTTGFGASPKIGGTIHNIFTNLEHCDEVITLACLRQLYNFYYVSLEPKKNSIGVVEYTPQTHIPSDFDVFFGNYSKSQVGERPTLVSIDGGSILPPGDIGESSLDLQYVMGLIGNKEQEVLLLQAGDAVESASFNQLLDAFDASYCSGDDLSQDPPYPDPYPGGYKGPETCGGAPQAYVVSTSYGYQEAELTPAYMQRQCAEYGKLSLTGMTFVFSSGDSGVAGFDDFCLEDNGNEVPYPEGTRFNPTFPGGCPYVTSVGATQVVPGNSVHEPESAVFQRFPTGGGFSNIFPRASFQSFVVSHYLEKYPPPYASPSIYNATGRGYPDLSANGLNYSVAANGEFALISGTSASAPTVAAILSQINDARLALRKGPIGWANPALYSFPSLVFNDITNGTNPGCGTEGFKAQAGWDPLTGLGTPNFALMLAEFLSLP